MMEGTSSLGAFHTKRLKQILSDHKVEQHNPERAVGYIFFHVLFSKVRRITLRLVF